MEFYCFLITLGMLMAFAFVGIGIVLGRIMEKSNERVSERELRDNNNSNVLHNDNNNLSNCPMGNIHE